MTQTTDPKKSVKQLYDEGMAEVYRVILNLSSSDTQVEAAENAAKDLTAMLVSHTLESVEGRTALLAALIVELNEVTDASMADTAWPGAVSKLTSIVDSAKALFEEEKKKLA